MESRLVRRCLVALWLVTVTAVLAWAEARPTIAAPSLAVGGLLLGIGFAVTAVLLGTQEDQQDNALLFGLLTIVWVASQVGEREVGALSPVLLFVGGFTQVVAAAVLLRYPGRRLDPASRRFVVVTAVLLGVIQAGLLVTSRPADFDENLTDRPWPSLWVDPAANLVLWRLRWAVWAVGGLVFLALLWRRWRRMGAMERRTLVPIVATASVTAALIGARFVDDIVPRWAELLLADVRAYSAAAVSVAFAVSALHMSLARSGVARLASDLAGSVSLEGVQAALRRTLADPGLEVWYWLPERGQYVDMQGHPRSVPGDGARLVLPVSSAHGDPMTLVVADVGLIRHRALVDAAVAVSRLAMENAQLQASLRSQLVAVRQARFRLLHTGLEQRRRLERDLHDGAQQRLLALGMRLGLLESEADDPDVERSVRLARQELHQALDELRDLAHGLYPAILTQAGLGPALEAVAERLPVPVTLDVEPGRWPPDVESAAYLIACEAVTNACKHAGPCRIHVQVRQKGEVLVIDATDDGVGSVALTRFGALRGMRDRVDAMGGTLRTDSAPGRGTRLVAELPCA